MRGLTKAFLVCAVPGLLFALSPGAWAINAANATATLLPDENILVTGGSSTIASPGILNTATLDRHRQGIFRDPHERHECRQGVAHGDAAP